MDDGAGRRTAVVPRGAWQQPPLTPPPRDPAAAAADEAHWRRVAAQYRVTDKVVNLEAGYWGMMSIPVHEAFLREVEPEEIAFTRSATESPQLLIGGYNRLKPGDAVLYADLDYPAMQNAMKWLAERRGFA